MNGLANHVLHLRRALGLSDDAPDELTEQELARRVSEFPKPCWELRYCPYGWLVEMFPLPPLTREQARRHIDYLSECLKTGRLGNGEPLPQDLRSDFEAEIAGFKPDDYPIGIPKSVTDTSCSEFGHLCPVFFAAELVSENKEKRKRTRHIRWATRMRVIRRDNYTCQVCGRLLRDDEIQLDHIIPWARGGTSDERNLRVTCAECNRKKGHQTHL